MLEEKDLQAIGTLLDQKLKENNQSLKTEIFGEMDKKFTSQKREISGEMDKKFAVQNGEIDKKFAAQKNEIFGEMDRRFDEVLGAINETFSEHEKRFDKLEVEIAKRPTREEMFGWADNRFTDLELAKDRHDYLHIDDLDKLPAPIEMSKALIERGFKQQSALKGQ